MVTFNPAELIDANRYRISWTSDQVSPVTNRVYLEGVLVSTQVDLFEYEVYAAPGQVPVLEVLDEADDVPSPAFPGYLTLGWMADDEDVERYIVEEYVGAAWVERAQMVRQEGDEYLKYQTDTLEDVTVANWRVTPMDAAGNLGTLVSFVALMVRYPDPPEVEYSYDAGTGKVTVTAA